MGQSLLGQKLSKWDDLRCETDAQNHDGQLGGEDRVPGIRIVSGTCITPKSHEITNPTQGILMPPKASMLRDEVKSLATLQGQQNCIRLLQ